MYRFFSIAIAALVVVLAGCKAESTPETYDWPVEVISHADSVALRALDYVGGASAWRTLPYLRFNFAYHPGNEPRPPRKHLWDRMDGRYRLEYQGGVDSTYVVLFDTGSREGRAYLNGEQIQGEEADRRVSSAYGSFINDTYWLLMPAKLLDPGVNRTHVADSSNAATDVLNLTFGDVGLTPGDTYWIWSDASSGQVSKWAYVLQRNPDANPTHWRWEGWQEFSTDAGPVMLSSKKSSERASIFTDAIELPKQVDDALFTDPTPRLN